MAAVVDVGRDGRPVGPVEPGDRHSVVHGPAVRAAIGADALHVPDADGRHRVAALPPRLLDDLDDPVTDDLLRARRPVEVRPAVGVGADELEALPWDPGAREDLAGHLALQARQHLEKVGHDERDRRTVVSFDHQRPRVERVMDATGTRHPGAVALELHAQGGRDVRLRRTDLHDAPPRVITRPVRLDSYAAAMSSTASRPSCAVTPGGRPVRTASAKSVYWRR